MVDTVEEAAPEPASAPPHRTWGDWVRFALRGIGQVLITAGVIVLLFVVYEVYVTNYFAHEAQSKVKRELIKEFVERKDPLGGHDGKLRLPGSKTPAVPEGTGIAFLYIPRLGQDFAWAIVQGTTDADLEKGPGHYIGSALPGQVGNFAVAGHRVGKGEPFLNLDHVQAGDAVVVQTESKWFVYRVLGDDGDIDKPDPAVQNIVGREIVTPTDSAVLYPVPDHSSALTPTERLMTMTTCHPKFTASHRMVLHAVLAKTYPASGITMPAPVKNLYSSQES